MSEAYNAAFNGCFCSCHFTSFCRNTSYHQNNSTSHKSQLTSFQNPMVQHMSRYPFYQSPPQNFLSASQQFIPTPELAKIATKTDSVITGAPDNVFTNNRAPYPASAIMAPVSMRTQSQPFQISSAPNTAANRWQSAAEETQCSCDSILSRLIYGQPWRVYTGRLGPICFDPRNESAPTNVSFYRAYDDLVRSNSN